MKKLFLILIIFAACKATVQIPQKTEIVYVPKIDTVKIEDPFVRLQIRELTQVFEKCKTENLQLQKNLNDAIRNTVPQKIKIVDNSVTKTKPKYKDESKQVTKEKPKTTNNTNESHTDVDNQGATIKKQDNSTKQAIPCDCGWKWYVWLLIGMAIPIILYIIYKLKILKFPS